MTRSTLMNRLPGILATSAVVAGGTTGYAQSQEAPESPILLPPITVLGTSLSDPFQTSSSAVTVHPGSLILPGGITAVRDLTTAAPNFSVFDSNNDRTPRFSVRGLRENNFAAGEAAVGMYVDDVPYLDLSSRGLPLYDVKSLEFVRGPQGTLYGAGAAGGVMNIKTQVPNNECHGQAGFAYGNYDQQTADFSLSGPIVKDQFFAGFSGRYDTRDGFVNNSFRDTQPDTKESLGGRLQLRWTPTDRLEFALITTAERYNDGMVPTYYPTVDAGPFDVARDYEGFVDTESYGAALKAAWTGEVMKVMSITSLRHWEQDLAQDFDFSSTPAVIGFSRPSLDQITEEIRLQSTKAESRCEWTAGFFFANTDRESESGSNLLLGTPIPFPPFFVPGPLISTTTADFQDQTYALFGQTTVKVLDSLDVIAGLRLELDHREIDRQRSDDLLGTLGFPQPAPYSLSEDFTAALPKAGLVYHLNETSNLYLTGSTGFQSGGFNASNDNPAESAYDSSYSWHAELGYKSDCLADVVTARISTFYSRFDNYQVFRFNQMDPTQAFVVNADQAYSFGAEAELEARPLDGCEISIGAGVVEAKFDDFQYSNSGNNYDFSGNRINFVPQFTANMAAQYKFPFNVYVRMELQAVGDYYLDESNTVKQPAYVLLHARAGYEHKHFGVHVFARNLLDEEYFNNAIDFRSAASPDLLVRQPGNPLTFGFAVVGRF